MAKKRIRVALIGCGGNMRGAHVPRLQEDGAVELVAVAGYQLMRSFPSRAVLKKSLTQ